MSFRIVYSDLKALQKYKFFISNYDCSFSKEESKEGRRIIFENLDITDKELLALASLPYNCKYKGTTLLINEGEDIKKIEELPYLVCPFGFWNTSEKIIGGLERMREESRRQYKINYNVAYTSNSEIADYHIIFTQPREEDKGLIDIGKYFCIQTEPIYLFKPKYVYDSERNFWEYSIDNLEVREKTKDLSLIVSNLQEKESHKKRLNFCYALNNKINLDFYGRGHNKDTKNYKGEIKNKSSGLKDYKYTIAIENCREPGYITEKLIDGILSECLVFYIGAPDINKWIDSSCYIELDINDVEKSVQIIKEAMEAKEWEKRIDKIRREKERIVRFELVDSQIERIIKAKDKKFECPIYVMGISDVRMERVKKRLQAQNLTATFVKGYTKNSDHIKEIDKGVNHGRLDMISCFRTHLKAMKEFLKTDEKACIILEEDALLHHNFKRYFNNLNKNVPYICLSPHIINEVRLNKKYNNMYWLYFGIFSCASYYITRDFAKNFVYRFDKPLSEYSPGYLYEPIDDIVGRESMGYFCYPPIVIEDCLESHIYYADNHFVLKFKQWDRYDYSNFAQAGEDDALLKLAKERRVNRRYKEALEALTKVKSRDKFSYYFEMLIVSYYVDKDKGNRCIDELLENMNDQLKKDIKGNSILFISNAKFYDRKEKVEELIKLLD
jgi:GR25 family glycosyltransferase involved in LPS biosynthesis